MSDPPSRVASLPKRPQLAEERTARQRLADQVGALAQQREAADADAATYEAQHRGDCSRMEELQVRGVTWGNCAGGV